MKKTAYTRELRGFLLLWGSQTVSELGTAMTDYALIVWVYGQSGTASSVSLMTLCAFMPTILFRFIAGALADRWDKKKIMLIADLAAACGTATVLILYSLSALQIWHLYVVNALLSLMNAFQAPASFVATTLLVPERYYAKVSGLQGFSGAAVSILAPALGSAALAYLGMRAVLVFDLFSFAVAFLALLFLIDVPKIEAPSEKEGESFAQTCLGGIRYLLGHAAILRLTLFLAAVNFLAKLGNDGMLSPFILSRTSGDQRILGMVQSGVALGLLAGSLFVTWMKPAKKRTRLIFITTAVVFSANIVQSLTLSPVIWCVAAFIAYLFAAVMNANLTTIMRERVPAGMQGRVFSAKDTLQNCTIPLGLFLGGVLADNVFEPFMRAGSPAQIALSQLFGRKSGSGIALMFFCAGVLGVALCLIQLGKQVYETLD